MKPSILALLTALFLSSAVWASEMKSHHRGRLAEAGEYHVEMVAKGDVIEIYLADHNNKAVSAAGHKAVAIFVIDGKSQRIVLEPAGEQKLSGKATSALPATAKGVVQITPPKGKTVQARFN